MADSTRLCLTGLLLALAIPGCSAAGSTTYYVAADGSNDNPGTEAEPFRDPGGCIANMSGGDVCLIKDGVYRMDGAKRSRPGWDVCSGAPAINGTAEARTTFMAYPGHRPRLESEANAVIGAGVDEGRNPECAFITFRGLVIHGGFVLWGQTDGDGTTVHDIDVEDNEFSGGFDCDGNWSPVRLERVSNIRFRGNFVHGYDARGCTGELGTASSSMVKLFCVSDSLFELNTLAEFDARGGTPQHGFDDKDTSLRNSYRYNVIAAGGREGIRVGHQQNCGPDTEAVVIEGNLFLGAGVRVLHDVRNGAIRHNTFTARRLARGAIEQSESSPGVYWGGSSGTPVGEGWAVVSNIFDAVGSSGHNITVTANTWDARPAFDLNVYDRSADYRGQAFGPGDASYPTLHEWQEASGGDAGSAELDCRLDDDGTPGDRVGLCSLAGYTALTACVGHTCSAALSD